MSRYTDISSMYVLKKYITGAVFEGFFDCWVGFHLWGFCWLLKNGRH